MTRMKSLSPKDHLLTAQIYDEYERLNMVDGWYKGQKDLHFQYLLRLADLADAQYKETSCLDVGCGTGDLSSYLRKRDVSGYLGIDIYEPSIEKAKQKYPAEAFLLGDFLSETISQQFDYAFCSGALSVNLHDDNYAYLEATVEKMWQLTTRGICFNMLTDDDPEPDPDLFFYNLDEVIRLCRKIAPDASIKTTSIPHTSDITIYLIRNKK